MMNFKKEGSAKKEVNILLLGIIAIDVFVSLILVVCGKVSLSDMRYVVAAVATVTATSIIFRAMRKEMDRFFGLLLVILFIEIILFCLKPEIKTILSVLSEQLSPINDINRLVQ